MQKVSRAHYFAWNTDTVAILQKTNIKYATRAACSIVDCLVSQTLHKKRTCCSRVERTHIFSALHRNTFAIFAFLPMERILEKLPPAHPWTSSICMTWVRYRPDLAGSVSKTISLGPREGYIWARLRGWFGQPRMLNPAPSLHGLRELPFVCQLSFISIVCNL